MISTMNHGAKQPVGSSSDALAQLPPGADQEWEKLSMAQCWALESQEVPNSQLLETLPNELLLMVLKEVSTCWFA
jgi:hypothetical protein